MVTGTKRKCMKGVMANCNLERDSGSTGPSPVVFAVGWGSAVRGPALRTVVVPGSRGNGLLIRVKKRQLWTDD